MDKDSFEVIVIGAGVAGSSAAYHLQQHNVDDILILDAGPDAGEGLAPRSSGSATMDDRVAPCVKMMVQVFASSCDEFIKHHGKEGAKKYLTATRKGLLLQKGIAQEIWGSDCSRHLKNLGSYYLGYKEDYHELKREFELLLELECDADNIEWCEKERLSQVKGMSPKFVCGIYFPNEAVIDSSFYAKALTQYVLQKNKAEFRPNSRVVQIQPTDTGSTVTLQSGESLPAKHVVVATGALHQHPQLNGLLSPCYSYLVHVPTETTTCEESPNFFTWRFTHDWCYTNGKIRISGEDHFSAYKPPLCQERCSNLSRWTLEQYDCEIKSEEIQTYPQQYGLYSETPDLVPLVGSLENQPSICYLLGCNAWGQTILSYCSSLIPGLLGYKEMSDQERDILELVNIRRFSELPR